MDEIRTVFGAIDIAVFDFIALFEQSALTPLDLTINGMKKRTNALEYKGQILSLSRHWGYTPVDTDIVR